MDTDDRRVIAEAYTETVSSAEHHLRSFNAFLQQDVQSIVDEISPVETDVSEEGETPPVLTEFSDLQFTRPSTREADGSRRDIYPQDARLRDLTYSTELTATVTISFQRDDQRYVQDEATVTLGQLPAMVRSDACNLNNLNNDNLVAKGEDPIDPGGYFIINGTERVLLLSEDLVSNRIITEYVNRRGTQISVAKVYSQKHNRRIPMSIKFGQENLLRVSVPGYPDLRFINVVRALGLQTDREITQAITDHVEIRKEVLGQLAEADAETAGEARRELGENIAGNQAPETQLERVQHLLETDLLPHVNSSTNGAVSIRSSKARFLCRMANSCLRLKLGLRRPDDKDHYANKRIRDVRELMGMIFSSAFNLLCRDIDYHLKRLLDRNRSPAVSGVMRSEALTNRLKQPLATGNWPGGRTGVSQILDRTNHAATLSQLRRLQSPLSRSRPHFEARDLHATQWGRVCPSETPEGPNCGLVQNFARSVELSMGLPEENGLVEKLATFGVEEM